MPLPRMETFLVDFLRRETARAGFRRAVVGVSGGLDSAVVLLLAVRALGPENVLGLMMPFRSSSPASLSDAQAVVAVADCRSEIIDITPMIEAFRQAAGCDDPLRLGNRMARERMTLLYDRALRDQALVVGTGNKTEVMLGYSTRWGDGAYDLNPIGDLYKCHVRALAAHLATPASILVKPPSADLWPGQTDEGELGLTYDEADRILAFLVEQQGDPAQAAAVLGVAPETVRRVVARIERTQFKRETPPICTVQPAAHGIDTCHPRDRSANDDRA